MERVTHRRKPGPKFSEGARKMWSCIAKRQMTHAAFSREAERLSGAAWPLSKTFRYLWGERCPNRAQAETIREILGIDPLDFDRPASRPLRAVRYTPPAKKAA